MQEKFLEQMKPAFDFIHSFILKKDKDWITLITGYEGCGKSTLGLLLCLGVDPEFVIDRVCFSPEEFKKVVKNSKRGQAVLIDEGALLFYSRDSMKTETKDIIKLFTAMRQYNLFVIICVPNPLLIDKYLRDYRIRNVVRIVKTGRFFIYNQKNSQKIRKDKKTDKIKWPKPNFRGSFPKLSGELWNNYKKKKSGQIFTTLEKDDVKRKKRQTLRIQILEMYEEGIEPKTITRILNCNPSHTNRTIQEHERRKKQKMVFG